MLADNNVVILKFFLHISHDEQTRRLQARIDDPDKHWKLSEADFHERQFWPEYEEAYDDVLSATSRKHAPWFVIPSDHNGTATSPSPPSSSTPCRSLKLKYPDPTVTISKIKL